MIDKVPTEEQDQIKLLRWFDATYPNLKGRLAASSAGARMTWKTAKRQKAAGMQKGFPDLQLNVQRHGFAGLFIEMKRIKGGVISPEQADWQDFLNAQGYLACVCKGFEAARDMIASYLDASPLHGKGDERWSLESGLTNT